MPTLIVNRHPHIRISLRSLKTKTNEVLRFLGLEQSSVEITLVNDAFMKPMNLRYMKKSGTTDVLSFPQLVCKTRAGYRGEFLGDILISLDQARRQAKAQGISLEREVQFLMVHSVLHLIGHDHAHPVERLKMQKLESRIWKNLFC